MPLDHTRPGACPICGSEPLVWSSATKKVEWSCGARTNSRGEVSVRCDDVLGGEPEVDPEDEPTATEDRGTA